MSDFLSMPTLVILALVTYIKDTIELHLRDKRLKKAKGSRCG